MLLEWGEIQFNRRLGDDVYHLRLQAPQIATAAEPGQFIMARLSDAYEPLLRRPFSLFSADAEGVELVYQVVGRGTEILARATPGVRLDLLGPLGRPFTLPTPSTTGEIWLIAGGMGFPPLFFLASRLRKLFPKGKMPVTAMLGAQTAARLYLLPEWRDRLDQLEIATDDGSQGFPGMVTDLLLKRLAASGPPHFFYGCGPLPMIKRLSDLAREHSLPGEVSLEARMACGVGACLSCSTPVVCEANEKRQKRVCCDGPVFRAEEVIGFD